MKNLISKEAAIAIVAICGILLHLILRYVFQAAPAIHLVPLYVTLIFGGLPLVWDLSKKLLRREFGSDLLAGIAIVTSVILGEYLAGSVVVLMLSGGESLESYAVASASSVLRALAKRVPNIAHRRDPRGITNIQLSEIKVADLLMVFPHEVCPVDGVVIEGHGTMDEAYLTGEPYNTSKTPGSVVLSGAINGEVALTIKASRLPVDSRYAKIMEVMRAAEMNRPRLRRLGDQLGAIYTPLAVAIAVTAWLVSGEAIRFLAVLVIATPCPLLIAIPVAIIGSISLAAKRGIIIRNPAVLEQIDTCRTIILDKTGTLTFGVPQLTDELVAPGGNNDEILALAASMEQYSKHPLAVAILKAAEARKLPLHQATEISEPPGQGMRGVVLDRPIIITSRTKLAADPNFKNLSLPPQSAGLECVIVIDGKYAATYRFHDQPRKDSKRFIHHLSPQHNLERILLVSGDRESEVRYLADYVGISEVHASKSPEEKVVIVKDETQRARTIFLGDGVNDAPALMTATVGIAFGQNSDVSTQAADVVIMDTSLVKVDEFFHISRRMRAVALQSAIGGMALSVIGMILAAYGYLTPVAGAVGQEIIDVWAIANALRAAFPPKKLNDI